MELITKEVAKRFREYPLYSQEGHGMNSIVLAKFFNPCGAGTWLITEAEKEPDGDWLLFGYCHIDCWEWGYISYRELRDARLPYGLRIERDMFAPSNARVRDLL